MSKNKQKKSKNRPAASSPERQAAEAIEDLRETIMHLEADPDAGRLWGDAQHALMRTKADRKAIMRLIASRDVEELKRMLEALESGETKAAPAPAATTATDEPAETFDPGLLRRAMQAFRKRLKLARLDDESRLSVSPMSSGRHSQIEAILPPRDFPEGVWRELARRGDLIDAGGGFYELAEEHRD